MPFLTLSACLCCTTNVQNIRIWEILIEVRLFFEEQFWSKLSEPFTTAMVQQCDLSPLFTKFVSGLLQESSSPDPKHTHARTHTAFCTSRPRAASSSSDYSCKHLASSNFDILTQHHFLERNFILLPENKQMPIQREKMLWDKLRWTRKSYQDPWGTCWRLFAHSLEESPDTLVLSSQTDLKVHTDSSACFISATAKRTSTTNPASVPLRPCLRRSLSWMKLVNIWVSMNTSKNLRKLLEVTALRKASRWKEEEGGEEVGLEEEGLGEVGEVRDSSSRSAPPRKRE